MPIIIVKTNGNRFVVRGEPGDIKRWKSGRFIEVTELTGAKVAFNSDHVEFVSWISDERYAAQMVEQKRLQEEAQKKNPSPGREPRLVTPRAR
jgi:uncharacterized protein YlzI (FlbEa/FlbD family)